jgi:hypothetical protein
MSRPLLETQRSASNEKGKERRRMKTYLRENQALHPLRRRLQQPNQRLRLSRPICSDNAPRSTDAASTSVRGGGRSAAFRRSGLDDLVRLERPSALGTTLTAFDSLFDTVRSHEDVTSSVYTPRREERRRNRFSTHQLWQKMCWQIVILGSTRYPPHAMQSSSCA